MQDLVEAVQGFLRDADAVEGALALNRRRAVAADELRDAFRAFRDQHLPLIRLAERVGPHLEGREASDWGFANEDERRFAARFAAAAARLPEIDLASVLREYLGERYADDEERTQQLLAFTEFVAGLDGMGPEETRLGVGPAANFLTFAWHCLSDGREPVFSFSSTRSIKAVVRAGLLGSGAADLDPEGGLQERFRSFYRVARRLEALLAEAPALRPVRAGWAVEHALSWVGAALAGGSGAEPRPAPQIVAPPRAVSIEVPPSRAPTDRAPTDRAPTDGAPTDRAQTAPAVRIEPPRTEATPRPANAPAANLEPAAERPRTRTGTRRLDSNPALDVEVFTPATAQRRSRFMDIARKRVVREDETGRLFDRSGGNFDDMLPKDRVQDVPFFPQAQRPPQPPTTETPPHTTPHTTTERPAPAADASSPPAVVTPLPPAPEPAPLRGARAPDEGPRDPARDGLAPGADGAAPTAGRDAHTPPSERVTARLGDESSLEEDSLEPTVALDALLSEFRKEVVQVSRGDSHEAPASDRLAQDLYLGDELWADMIGALAQRSRLLLVGPPASGKTYVARRLAIHAAGHDERVLAIRLHPATRYEDLIDGPGGPGLVRAFCERAREDREHRHVLLLDELDRGDAPRALGELLGAMSEPGRSTRLARSHAPFTVPRNLSVLATARRLPHDPSLVGRFPAVALPADPAVLSRFLAHRRPGFEWVADLFAALCRRVREAGHTPPVGHGLFMEADLDLAGLRGLWRREVLPLLAAQGLATDGLEFDALAAQP